MKLWCLGLLILFIAGCGEKSNSSNISTELDGEAGVYSQKEGLGLDLEQLKQSPLFHEFDVDFFNTDPIQNTTTFTVSNEDTYKISLKTLDFLEKPTRFSLVRANNIVQSGMPKVIAPLGYRVNLKIEKNEVIAEIQSTTLPKESPKLVSILGANDDIIVGDLSPLQLQVASVQKDLSSAESKLGLTSCVNGINRYFTYRPGAWMTQLAQQRLGKDTLVSAQTGITWKTADMGDMSVSLQSIYRLRDAAYVNLISLKYVLPLAESWGQWQLMTSSTLNKHKSVAIGIGWAGKLWADSKVSVGIVASSLELNSSVQYTLSF